jgi:hemerythrin-like metal-binding protein
MPLLKWDNEKYDVGSTLMNNQHEQLLNYINDLNNAINMDKENETLSTILNQLFDYAKTHFEEEEALLLKFDYPQLLFQKESHAAFLNQITQFSYEFQTGSSAIHNETLAYLKTWLFSHILKEDKYYEPYFRNQESAPQT